jgi:hypothetical protein
MIKNELLRGISKILVASLIASSVTMIPSKDTQADMTLGAKSNKEKVTD